MQGRVSWVQRRGTWVHNKEGFLGCMGGVRGWKRGSHGCKGEFHGCRYTSAKRRGANNYNLVSYQGQFRNIVSCRNIETMKICIQYGKFAR